MTSPTVTVPAGRILIRGAHLLAQDPAVADGPADVLIEDGLITGIGHDLDADGAAVIDGTGCALLPGFIDTHRHTWQGAIRQTGIGWNFPTYRRYIQNTWGPAFTPEDVYIGNRIGALDAINAGITTLRDESHISNSPEHTDQAIAALRDSGIRAVFAYGWPSIDSDKWMLSGTQTHPEDIRRIRGDVLPDDTALVTLNAMLRGAELSSPEVTAADVRMSRELGVAMSMHVGNGPWGPQFRGIGTLADLGLLGPDMLFIHCCTSADDELKAMVDAGAHASVAAAIEAALPGLGAPATARLIAAGTRPSFSIDTEASVAGDMFNVMRAAISAHGLGVTFQPEVYEALPEFTPADLLSFATIDGAIAAGLAERAGSITVGKAADVVLVRVDDANMLPTNDITASLVGAGHSGNVETVIIAGVVRKHGGQLVGADVDDLRARAAASRDRLFARPAADA
jgi:5-methylthioadenosine/S-adenosylhomocysteine deaminase